MISVVVSTCRPVVQPQATRNDWRPDGLVMCAPATTDKAWYDNREKAPLFDSLGDWSFPVTTTNALVQRYCDQGLTLAYGFNHAEAARSYDYARRLDPNCAMAHWGYAYVLGPNYNAGMEADNYERAYAAVREAQRLVARQGTDLEKALITALAERYTATSPEDRRPLDSAYAVALEKVYARFPTNDDVGTLYAEALMDLHPWDLYDSAGAPRPWTPEIVTELEKILARTPGHPGANHLYIHAVEASSRPERGLASAGRFDAGLVPGSGHLVHMPSHIYLRTGDYHLGSLANLRSVEVDSNYITACRAQGVYPLAYHPHNYHFLAATATLEGKMGWAVDAARRIARHSDNALLGEPGWGGLQQFTTIPDLVDVKFERWQAIFERPDVAADLPYPRSIQHYARGLAYLGTNQPGRAARELKKLRALINDDRIETIRVGVNTAGPLVQIAERVLTGEIAAQEQDWSVATAALEEAIAFEDDLSYIEPPDWFFSVRQRLGAILLEAGDHGRAVQVYTEDLSRFPRNGWALSGLVAAYRGQGLTEQALEADAALQEAWRYAEVELSGSKIR